MYIQLPKGKYLPRALISHHCFVAFIFLGTQKTLMYFDGCAAHLGCTIALRGGSSQELRKVKNIVRFLVYCAYHSRLETSFLMDEFALPPSLAGELDISALSNDGPSDDNIVLVGDATDNDAHSSDE